MRRALHIGIFIGTLLGVSACMTAPDASPHANHGAYGSVEAGGTR